MNPGDPAQTDLAQTDLAQTDLAPAELAPGEPVPSAVPLTLPPGTWFRTAGPSPAG